MTVMPCPPLSVIPAQAGISRRLHEIPAFAGMTASAACYPSRNMSPPPAGGRVREGVRIVPAPLAAR